MIEGDAANSKPASRRPLLGKIIPVVILIVFIPYVIAAGLVHVTWTIILYFSSWILWLPRGRSVLFVHSDSPVWSGYLEKEMFPYIEQRTVFLNWSERKHWKPGLAVMAFRHFGGSQNFNPMAIVFRPFRIQKSFRFYEAFKDFKHGNPESVERMKRDLFDCLGIHEDT